MSQNDMVIANQGFPAFRSDLNAALQALASTNSGSTRPSTAYAGQLWLDTNTPSATVWSLFCYDGTDDILLGYVDATNNVFSVAHAQAQDVASATTTVLDTAYGMVVDVTGTTAITAITLAQGQVKIVRFTGALTLTHGSSLVLPTAANITTAAGDYAIFVGYASSVVRCAFYSRANGTTVAGSVASQSGPSNPTGTTSTVGVMMGLAGSFTPTTTGKVSLTVTGGISSSGTAGAFVRLYYGTGSAPANAAAVTGTAANSNIQSYTFAASSQVFPFTSNAVITGLTPGTAYWYDLVVGANTSGTAAVNNINMTAFEIK